MGIDVQRGDIVICTLQGDYGKGRPALIVQSNLFNATHASIVVCPITSHIIEAPLFRISISPTTLNNLKKPSQVMVDKLTAIKRERINEKIGAIIAGDLEAVDQAIKLWLHLSSGALRNFG